MEAMTQKDKVLVLAKSDPDIKLERRLAKEGYKVVRFGSGADTLDYISANEPNLIVLFGLALSDMLNYELVKKINALFPNRKARTMVMYECRTGEGAPVIWNEWGVDVMLPRLISDDSLHEIFTKIKEMNSSC